MPKLPENTGYNIGQQEREFHIARLRKAIRYIESEKIKDV
jgi:hypothetical protein